MNTQLLFKKNILIIIIFLNLFFIKFVQSTKMVKKNINFLYLVKKFFIV